MDSNEIYSLMKDLQVQLNRITAFEPPITKPDLEAFTKVVRAQAVPAPDSAKVAQALLPELVKQLPGQLPMKVDVQTDYILAILSPLVNKQVTAIQATNERVLREMGLHLVRLEALLEKGRQASLESEARYGALVTQLPKTVSVNLGQGWRRVAAIAMGTLAVVMLILALAGVFRKEPVRSYNDLVSLHARLLKQDTALRGQQAVQQQKLSALEKERNAYRDEVLSYRKKFPKARIAKANYPGSKVK